MINFLWNSSSRKSCLWKSSQHQNQLPTLVEFIHECTIIVGTTVLLLPINRDFYVQGASKTPDGFNFLRQSGKILLTYQMHSMSMRIHLSHYCLNTTLCDHHVIQNAPADMMGGLS